MEKTLYLLSDEQPGVKMKLMASSDVEYLERYKRLFEDTMINGDAGLVYLNFVIE